MSPAQLEAAIDARTVPTRGAPKSNGNRHGRPFTLRIENQQEDKLRRELARLELLPFADRPRELFGWDAGGGAGRRRASLGWFLVWAALQYCEGKARRFAGEPANKPRAQRVARTTRRKGKTRTRPRAGKRSKKGGRR